MFSPIPRNGRCTTSTGSTVTTFRRAGRVEQAPTARSRTSILILADLILAVARARRGGGRASAISSASFLALGAGGRGGSRRTKPGAAWDTRSRSDFGGGGGARGEKVRFT